MAQASQSEAGRAGLPALSQVTLGYNRARVQEACGQPLAAANAYKGILAQLPGEFSAQLGIHHGAYGWMSTAGRTMPFSLQPHERVS